MDQPQELLAAAARLADTSNDLHVRRKAAEAIKEGQEAFQTPAYPQILEACVPALLSQLTDSEPQTEDTELQKLRHAALEVLARLLPAEAARSYVSRILETLLLVMKTDNQRNAVVATKCFNDTMRAYGRTIENVEQYCTSYLEFVKKAYTEFPTTFADAFEKQPMKLPHDFSPSYQSFKILADCQQQMLMLMQLSSTTAKAALPALAPLLVSMAAQRFSEESLAAAPAATGPPGAAKQASPHELWQAALSDVKVAQVRTANFLTVVMRNFPEETGSYQSAVVTSIFYLFRTTPDCVAVRKELLASTRYMVAGPSKGSCFHDHIEELLNEETMLTPHLAAMDSLRPIAIMTLCEILHHVRKQLSLPQLGRVVDLMSCYVMEHQLPYQTQSTCVRLSLNLVECLYQSFKRADADMAGKEAAQQLLSKILHSFVRKLKSLQEHVGSIIAAARAERTERDARCLALRSGNPEKEPTVLHTLATQEKEKEVNDCKLIVQNVIYGMKTLLFSILYCTRQVHQLQQQAQAATGGSPGANASAPIGMHHADVRCCGRLLVYGLKCLKVASYFGQNTEFCEHFADMFTVLDSRDFVDVFTAHLPALFDTLLAEPDMVTVAAHLVHSQMVGRIFSALLAQYLVEHQLQVLSDPGSKEALLVQKLFKLVCIVLNLPDGELLLVGTLESLVDKCLKAAVQEKDPLGHLALLRQLFKVCHQAREMPKQLYERLSLKLPNMLQTFLAMLNGPNCTEHMRPLLVELCLTLPGALGNLLPLLSKLMRPLIMALRSSSEELLVLGLRTLDTWVDSLNPEFLEPAMVDVLHELLPALWALIKPVSNAKAPAVTATMLLGKLGGRNRKFLRDPLPLEYKEIPEHGLRVILTFHPHSSFLVPLDRIVPLAVKLLGNPGPMTPDTKLDLHYKEQVLLFVHMCLGVVLNLKTPSSTTKPPGATAAAAAAAAKAASDAAAAGAAGTQAGVVAQQPAAAGDAPDAPAAAAATAEGLQPKQLNELDQLATVLMTNATNMRTHPALSKGEGGAKTKQQLLAERQMVISLVRAAIGAAGDERLAASATAFSRGLARHFAMLFVAEAVPPSPIPTASSQSSTADGADEDGQQDGSQLPQGMCELDGYLFLDALVQVLSGESPAKARAAVDALSVFITTLLQLHAARQAHLATAAAAAGAGDGPKAADQQQAAGAAAAGGQGGAAVRQSAAGRVDAGGEAAGKAPSGSDDAAAAPGFRHASGSDSKEISAASAGASATAAPAGGGAAAAGGASSTNPGAGGAGGPGGAAARQQGGSSHMPRVSAAQLGLPPVLDVVVPRIVHCCWEDSWSARLGGVAAVKLLLRKLPTAYVAAWAATLARALLMVVRKLPDHATVELEQVEQTLKDLLDLCFKVEQSAADAAAAADADGAAEPAGEGAAAGSSKEAGDGKGAAQQEQGKPDAEAKAASPKEADTECAKGDADLMDVDKQEGKEKEEGDQEMQEAGKAADGGAEEEPTPVLLPVTNEDALQGVVSVLLNIITQPLSCERMRSSAATAMTHLAKRLLRPVSLWLRPHLALHNPPLVLRKVIPIRTITFIVGQVNAATWCLASDSRAFAMGDVVLFFARDMLLLADKDEEQLYARLSTQRGVTLAAVQQLRVSCINMLAELMLWDPYRQAKTPQAVKQQEEILSMFFRALMSQNAAVHGAAMKALNRYIKTTKIPKEWLSNSLRPILQNLGNHKSLSLQLLQGLHRLLQLLSDWFNLSLGDKLIDHLVNWLDPDALTKNGPTAWQPGEEVMVAAGILNLFYLLPKAAVKFLESHSPQMGLVVLAINLEEKLGRSTMPLPHPHIMSSPYREPLARFLNRFPEQAVGYFLDPARIVKPAYFELLLAMLHMPLCEPLRERVAASQEQLLALLAHPPPEDGANKQPAVTFQAVHLIHMLSRKLPDWLPANTPIYEALLKLWQLPTLVQMEEQQQTNWMPQAPQQQKQGQAAEGGDEEQQDAQLAPKPNPLEAPLLLHKRIAVCALRYIRVHSDQTKQLLQLLELLRVGAPFDRAFLTGFISNVVTKEWDLEQQRKLLWDWVTDCKASLAASSSTCSGAGSSSSRGQDLPEAEARQVVLLAHLVQPLLQHALDEGQQVLDDALVDVLVKDVLTGPEEQHYSELLRMRLLQMCTLVVRCQPPRLKAKPNHGALVKLCWGFLKAPDESPCKPYAFVTVAHLLRHHTFGYKLVLQVWVALLRYTQPEVKRGLLKEALDLMVDNLVDQAAGAGAGAGAGAAADAGRSLHWASFIRRTLLEEVHANHNLISLLQLLVRHPLVFYPKRHMFVQQVVAALPRLGLPQHTTLDNRKLAIDLSALLVTWEEQRQENLAAAGVAPEAAASADVAPADKDERKRPHPDSPTASAAAGPSIKQEPREAAGSEGGPPPAKQQKLDDGSAAAGGGVDSVPESRICTPTNSAAAPGGSSSADGAGLEDKLTTAQAEQLVSFLVRMAFLLVESTDQNLQAVYQHVLSVLRRALKAFHPVPLKLTYISKLMEAHVQKDAGPVLSCAWEVFCMVLEIQGPGVLATTYQQFSQMLAPTFGVKQQHTVDCMGRALRLLFAVPPEPPKTGEATGNGESESAGEEQVQAGVKADPSGPQPMQIDQAPAAGGGGQAAPGEGVGAAPAAAAAAVDAGAVKPEVAVKTEPVKTEPVKEELDAAAAAGAAPAVDAAAAAPAVAAAAAGGGTPGPVAPAVPTGPQLPEIVRKLQEQVLHLVMQALVAAQDANVPLLASISVHNSQGGAQPVLTATSQLLSLCAALCVLRHINDLLPPDIMPQCLPNVLKALNRCTRDLAQQVGVQHLQHLQAVVAQYKQQHMRDSTATKDAPSEDVVQPSMYGTCTWAVGASFLMTGHELQRHAESKKLVLQSLIMLLAGHAPRQLDPQLILQLVNMIQEWLTQPMPRVSVKEGVLILQRLAAMDVERQQLDGPGVSHAWQKRFEDLMLHMCTSTTVPKELRDEIFMKVERLFLCGLRSNNPQQRARFLQLYQTSIPINLYDRMDWVVTRQEWQNLATQFWLKQAMDIILGILLEDEDIILAHNSAHLVPLLPGTQPNVFSTLEHQHVQAQERLNTTMAAAWNAAQIEVQLLVAQHQADAATAAAAQQHAAAEAAAAAAAEAQAAAAAAEGAAAGAVVPAAPGMQADAAAEAAGGAAPAAGAVPFAGDGAQHAAAPGPMAMDVDGAAAAAPADPAQQAAAAGIAQAAPAAAADGGAAAVAAVDPALQQQQVAAPNLDELPLSSGARSILATVPPNKRPTQPVAVPLGTTLEMARQNVAHAVQLLQGALQAVETARKAVQDLEAGKPPAVDVAVDAQELPAPLQEMVSSHVAWLRAAGASTLGDWVRPLKEIMQVDSNMAYLLWLAIYPICWSCLEKNQQVALAKPIIQLLSKEHHQRQAGLRPNVVQAMLEAISVSSPQPKLPPELIKHLGKTYNAWHIAIPLLESHVLIFPDELRCFDALAEMYKGVNEEDMLFGLWRKRCRSEGSKVALSLLQWGMWDKAEQLLGELNNNAAGAQILPQDRGEMCLWAEQWVNCAKQLNQWDVLLEYAKGIDNSSLMIDAQWRLNDWDGLRNSIREYSSSLDSSINSYIVRCYSCLQEMDLANVEQVLNYAIIQGLTRWWQMPDVGGWPQQPLMQSFQQLVEVKESMRVLADLNNQQTQRENAFAEVKEAMETWRLRLPNEWDSLLHWQDVLMWRNHIYSTVINVFTTRAGDVVPQLHQMGYRDKAWAVNTLGHVATRHNCPEMCLSIINHMYGYSAMEVQEAFVKIKEQGKAFLALGDLSFGLNMLNTTNLDYFSIQHQAEIFRLRGVFQKELNDPDAASIAFSTSLMLCRTNAEAWVSWGQFNDEAYQRQPDHSNATRQLQYAALCYCQALKLGAEDARDLLPRLLYLLSFENREGVVGEQLQKHAADIPVWMWFMWIPQLLTGLTRPEVAVVKPLLRELASMYPQALYYQLRAYLLALREAANRAAGEHKVAKAAAEQALAAAQAAAGGAGDEAPAVRAATQALAEVTPPSEAGAFDVGKEVMEKLRGTHPVLCATLEGMVVEIGARFTPRPEERLLLVVTALLHRCYKAPVAYNADVPSVLKRELGGVCKACFSSENSAARTKMMPIHVSKAFVAELDPDGGSFPPNLGALADCLKAWRNKLQAQLEDTTPPCLNLEEESEKLQEMCWGEVELPGQYLSGHEVTPESNVLVEGLSSNVAIVRRQYSSYRRLSFLCSDGRTRHMLVQSGQNTQQGQADERMMQLLRLFNSLLDRQVESRRRLLHWHTPIMVPVWPQVRLLEDEPSYCTYGDAYEINCARFGREPDVPIQEFKKHIADEATGQYRPDPDGAIRLASYRHITERAVQDNVFSQYIYKTMHNANHMQMFKKNLCSQMALSAVSCFALLLSGRAPNKILLARDSGRVLQLELMPIYDEGGLLARSEAVPFRLTRNLAAFFGAFGVEGVFLGAAVAAAAALLAPGTPLPHLLGVFFKEDLLSVAHRRGSKAAANMTNDKLKGMVAQNVTKVSERIKGFAPLPLPDGEVPRKPVHQGAMQLLDAATDPRHLSRMDPTWHPWF